MDLVTRNPTELSNDLNVITEEINEYQCVAGEAIFEIGKRLKHVKTNDLAHGQWSQWVTSINMTRQYADMYIAVYEDAVRNIMWNDKTSCQLANKGVEARYQISQIPVEERDKEHTLSSGKVKKVEDMTVKELREVKKALKEAQKRADEAEHKNEALVADNKKLVSDNGKLGNKVDRLYDENEQLYEQLQNTEPEIVEKVVEVKEVIEKTTGYTEDDIKKAVEKAIKKAEEEYQDKYNKLSDKLENKYGSNYKLLSEELQRTQNKLAMYESNETVNIHELQKEEKVVVESTLPIFSKEMDNFVEKFSYLTDYKNGFKDADINIYNNFIESFDNMLAFIRQIINITSN